MKKARPAESKSSETFRAFENFNVCVYGPPDIMKKRAKEIEKQRRKAQKQKKKEKTSDTEKED